MNELNKIRFLTGILLLIFSIDSGASLINRGNGLLYDPDLDITWLADGNYAKTSGYDDDGKMTWSAANTWVQQLDYRGFTNWRLPTTLDPDSSCVELESIEGPYDYYCSGSEMGHLFYTELGAVPIIPSNSAVFGPDLALFSNLQRKNYWSSTEAAVDAIFPSCTSNCVWDFDFKNGIQTGYRRGFRFYALAVHPGDIGSELETGDDEMDTDGDGISDVEDNCTLISNPTQLDADGDGYGNRCDADLDDDKLVTFKDRKLFKAEFNLPSPDPIIDFNGDGLVNRTDSIIFWELFGSPPGPSGLAP